ncbi:Uncharacterised protein [Salmonella enterica subsp. enterica]|nr:Uncharacterised protein [Salmonella enterica subsp. enterica]
MTPTANPSIVKLCSRRSTTIGVNSLFSGSSSHFIALLFQAFYCHFIVNASDNHLAITDVLRFMYRQQIPIHNTDVFHRHTAHAQQEIGAGFEQ